ncbi:MAG: hypothetical protein AAF914_07025 [Pseudomonadota bacterium]
MVEAEPRKPVRMHAGLSSLGCFLAVEVGAFVVIAGLSVVSDGLQGILEALLVWLTLGQVVVLPVALLAIPFGLGLRYCLGQYGVVNAKSAIVSGVCVGVVGVFVLAVLGGSVPFAEFAYAVVLCAAAGSLGGWVWWRVEKPWMQKNA